MAAGLRGFLLAAVTIGIPVLWAFVPYAYRVGEMQYMTFGSITLKATRHIAEHRDWHPQYALGLPIFLGLLVPLYPALQAARLLIAPSQLAARRRWVWFVEGPALLLLVWRGDGKPTGRWRIGIGVPRRRRFSTPLSGCCRAVWC